MKIQPIMHVTGIRIELSLDEALLMVQNQRRGDRIVDEIRTMLRGSGVDPDTGERIPSVLGLQAAPVKALPLVGSSVEPEISSLFECPYCGKKTQTEPGLKTHITRVHPSRSFAPIAEDDGDLDLD